MKKRVVSISLCLVMLLSLFALPAYAAPFPPMAGIHDLGVQPITCTVSGYDLFGQPIFHFTGAGGASLSTIIYSLASNCQPGDKFTITFKLKNDVDVLVGGVLRKVPLLVEMGTEQGEDDARGIFIPIDGTTPTSGDAKDDHGLPYMMGQYPPNLFDKIQFKSYYNVIPAGSPDVDVFRPGGTITGSPAAPAVLTQSGWMATWESQSVISKTMQPNDIIYLHYFFEYNGNGEFVAPGTGGATPGATPGDPGVRSDNDYMQTHALVQWYIGAAKASNAGYIVKYVDEHGNTLKADRVVPANIAGLFAGDLFKYYYNAAVDDAGMPAGYYYIYNINPSNVIAYPPNPCELIVLPDIVVGGIDVIQNVVTLVYRLRGPDPTPPNPTPPTPSPATPTPPLPSMSPTTDPGTSTSPVDTLSPTPPPVEPPVSGGGDGDIDTIKPTGGPTDIPYTGGSNLSNLFFIGAFLFVLGILYLKGQKKKKNSGRP